MNTLILVKAVFIVGCGSAAMVMTVMTNRSRLHSLEDVRNEYAMPRVVGYGLATLFALLSLNELGHLIALVRGGTL